MKKLPKKVKKVAWGSPKKKDHYAVVLEDLRAHFKSFGESLDFVRDDVKEIKDTLGEHGRRLSSHSQMIGRIMIDVEEIKSGMREKIDRAEFNKFEKRLVSLEATVFSGKAK